MKLKKVLLVLIFSFLPFTLNAQNFWQEVYTGVFSKPEIKISSNGNVYTVSDSILYSSSNHGINWQPVYVFSAWMAPMVSLGTSPTGVIYFCTDTLKKSLDNGITWIIVEPPYFGGMLWFLETNDVGDIFTETGVLIGSYSFRSEDEGATWTKIGVEQAFLNSIAFHPSGTTYAIYLGNLPPGINKLFKSTNKGNTWTTVSSSPADLNLIFCAENGYLFAVGPSLSRSTDEGITWSIVFPHAITHFSENQLGHLFVSVNGMGVFRSLDDGMTWQGISEGLGFLNVSTLNVDSAGYLYAIAGSTINNQTNLYRSVLSTIPVELVSFSAVQNDKSVELSWITESELNNSGFEIERSDNQNNEWKHLSFINGSGTTSEPQTYHFIDNDIRNAIYYYRLKQIDLDGSYEYSNIIEVKVTLANSFSLEQNYPNPFNPSTKIRYAIPSSGFVSIRIYDVLGNEAAVLVNEEQTEGEHEIIFDAIGLTSGMYVVTLNSGSMSLSRKVILLK